MHQRLRLALALATLLCGLFVLPAAASDCVYGTASTNKSQCYPTVAPIDPATGLPPAGNGGGGSGTTPTANLATSQASVTTTASNVSAAATGLVHRGVRAFSTNTGPVYFGKTSAVTATTGQRLDPGDYASFDSYTGDIFMITASGTATVGVDAN